MNRKQKNHLRTLVAEKKGLEAQVRELRHEIVGWEIICADTEERRRFWRQNSPINSGIYNTGAKQ